MADIAVLSAVSSAISYNDYTRLSELVLSGYQQVLADPVARKLISDKIMGVKTGKKPKPETQIRNDAIAQVAYIYYGQGLPKWNNPDLNKMSAARKAGKQFNVSESTVRKAMERIEKRATTQMFIEMGRAMLLYQE